ncbi:MAG: helix-turn-helix transcriptional regulator, partial [Campylobacteraceae bacterium]
ISQLLFKTPQKAENLRITQVDGYSMTPTLFPDSWVIFDISKSAYSGDGIYVLNFRNILMVKILQVTNKGTLFIKSANKDYDSYEIDMQDQSVFKIFGKVIKTIL